MLTLWLFSPEIIPAKMKPSPVYPLCSLSPPNTLSNHLLRNTRTFFLRHSGETALKNKTRDAFDVRFLKVTAEAR